MQWPSFSRMAILLGVIFMKKRIFTLLLAFFLLLSGCVRKPEPRETGVVIPEILDTYSATPDASLDSLFSELESVDAQKAEAWRHIMDFWQEQDERPVPVFELPTGLPEDDSLCLVVLGFELNADGTMQEELLDRLGVALRCAMQYPKAYVLCTGGGTASDAPEVTEAGLMGQWLLDNGLEEERLIIEDRSMTTVENALFSYGLLRTRAPAVRSLCVITSSYHLVWGSVLFEAALTLHQEDDAEAIHVISGASYPITNPKYSEPRRYLQMQLKSLAD